MTTEQVNNCFTLVTYNYENELFKSVDMGYVIHLDNPKYNKRKQEFLKELETYKPCKSVKIVLNKGFKRCKKDKMINTPAKDLTDVYFFILKHARQNNFNRIAIFEDDFKFEKDILNKSVYEEIDNYLKNGEYDIYSLGGIIYNLSLFSLFSTHMKVNNTTMSHACIYNKTFIDRMLDEIKQENVNHIDQTFKLFNVKLYKKMVSYQLMSPTENAATWDPNQNATSHKNMRMTHLSSKGYEINYSLMKSLIVTKVIVFLIFVFSILEIYKRLKK